MLCRAQTLINKLREFLKDFRDAGKELGADYISLVVACLENDGDNICSRLSPDMFCVIVELVLQTEACLEGERCLYLLAVSTLPLPRRRIEF